jgi:hypothetical protein
MEHDIVWERVHGPIPPKHEIHHKDMNPINNAIENLEMMSRLMHKRLHSGCEVREDGWWKPCRKCGDWYHIDHYPKRHDGVGSWCRKCLTANSVMNKRKRREAAKQ